MFTLAFRTDTEISRIAPNKRERELQAWQPDGPEGSANANANANGAATINPTGTGATFQRGDDLTFGPGSSGNGNQWDQFAANERLFGVRTHFDEDEYTTKLDRSAKDFKERERRAEQIAAEIIRVREVMDRLAGLLLIRCYLSLALAILILRRNVVLL